MNILFIHDHKFKVDKFGNHYTDGKFTNELFDSYIFSESDTICVIARSLLIEQGYSKFDLVNHPKLSFKLVKGVSPIQIFIFNFFYNINIFLKILKSDLNIVRLPSFLGLFYCFLCIFFKKKYFVEVVGHAKDSLLDSSAGFIKITFANIYFKLTQFVIKKAAGAIYVTKEALQQNFPCLGISEYASDVILKIDNKCNPKKDYGILNTPKIGLIGSFNNHYKGINFAIKTIAFLKEKRKLMVNLHILGHGKLLDEYQELAKSLNVDDQVFFDGLLPLEQVSNWLDKLDIYIQPSLTEGLPRSLIEAMSRGLPCVATNVGGIPELINKNFLVNPGDSLELSKKIKLLIESQELRVQQGNENILKSLQYDFYLLDSKRKVFWRKARDLLD